MKNFDLIPIFPYKFSWEFSRKSKYNEILNIWKITFQALDSKERHFFFGHSNSLYARATRAIVNHAPIREYHLRFFP